MKKIILNISAVLFFITVFISRSIDALDTSPSTSISGSGMFANAKAAMTPLNGIYRSMYTYDWSTEFNPQQCDGIKSYVLMGDVMGEDMVMGAQGSGWYWFDCVYNVKASYASNGWRSYDLWNAHYSWIANANYIIAAEETMQGTTADINNVIGQAYAIRAYSYDMLARMFSRTYKGHESEPGLPIYTEPTIAGTEGKPRSTVEEVYTQILKDINKAIELLKDATPQVHKTHINYAVANGLKARICLVMNDWAEAAKAAEAAMSNYSIASPKDITDGMNSIGMTGVMWGAQIIPDQADGWGTFFTHLDWTTNEDLYANRAPKRINKELYDNMGTNDARREWWSPDAKNPSSDGPTYAYIQKKFRFSDPKQWLADMIWMRIEEIYLTAAEAECRLGNESKAIGYLKDLMAKRDEDYVCNKTGTSLGALTSDLTGSLLEEILIQRRIELWGEFGRIFDIKRLKQGFTRTEAMGFPKEALLNGTNTQNPESYAWVLTIPQSEFDGNVNMDSVTDQNPPGDEKK